MNLRACVALAVLILTGGNAAAQEAPRIGEVLRDGVQVFGRHVPLPIGDWTVVGHGFGQVEGESPGPYGAILGLMLAQAVDDVVDGIVLVSANALPIQGGWGPPPECQDPALLHVTGVRVQGRNLSCAFAGEMRSDGPGLAGRPAYAAGLAEMVRRGWEVPDGFVVAGFRVGDRRDVVDLRYGFRSTAALAPRAPVAAHADPLATEVRRRVMTARMQEWIEEVRPRIDAALRAAPAKPQPIAPPWQLGRSSQDRAKEMAVWKLSLYKMATYRIVQTSLTFGIAYFITTSTYASSLIVFWQGATHMALFYGNELAWEWPRVPPVMAFNDLDSGR